MSYFFSVYDLQQFWFAVVFSLFFSTMGHTFDIYISTKFVFVELSRAIKQIIVFQFHFSGNRSKLLSIVDLHFDRPLLQVQTKRPPNIWNCYPIGKAEGHDVRPISCDDDDRWSLVNIRFDPSRHLILSNIERPVS